MSLCNSTHTQILALRTGLGLRIQIIWWQLAARNDQGLAADSLYGVYANQANSLGDTP